MQKYLELNVFVLYIKKMDSPLTHLLHAVGIAVVLYLVMRFALGQSATMALNRSILLGAVSVIYMILFGHGLPTHMKSV
jgi:hypothetical protein